MEKSFLSGNEAVALGAYQEGVHLVTGYPGTPSTEILEASGRFEDLWVEWSVNEKVALEVGLGAALAGGSALVTMKHVGLNVAADPLFSASHTGFDGSLVLAVADDPGMWSSQNEQDTRHYGRAAKVPVLEPSDSQEALEMAREAFRVSRQFGAPVILRLTTRVSHTRGTVRFSPDERTGVAPGGYEPDIAAQVLMPAFARGRHEVVEERLEALRGFSDRYPLNRAEYRDEKIGVISSGIAYQHARTALPEASTLKLGMTWPLPASTISEFVSRVEECWIIEELDPFIWGEVRALGLPVRGAGENLLGELSPARVLSIVVRGREGRQLEPISVPERPPVLCPGCPHRGSFYVLKEMNALVTGDIGCYTLGALPPLSALHTCTCMGAGIGQAVGIAAVTEPARPLVAVIGDSTFIHSGMTGLANLSYAGTPATVVILDNRTTAMTGQQPHPGSGESLRRGSVEPVDYEALGRSLGIERTVSVGAWNLDTLKSTLKGEAAAGVPSLVVVRGACVLLTKKREAEPMAVVQEQCVDCGACLDLGCPAILTGDDGVIIEAGLCTGCGLCSRVCPAGAIEREASR